MEISIRVIYGNIHTKYSYGNIHEKYPCAKSRHENCPHGGFVLDLQSITLSDTLSCTQDEFMVVPPAVRVGATTCTPGFRL